VDRGRCGRIELGEQLVRRLRAELVVEALQPLARPRRGRRRQLEVGQGRAQIEPGAADDDGRPAGGQDLVDCRVGQALVVRDRAFLVEAEVPDEPGLGLVGQDRQPAIDLHRIRGYELGRDQAGDFLGDGALARGRRPEDREDVNHGAGRGRARAPAR
jgi:hypothetical protein